MAKGANDEKVGEVLRLMEMSGAKSGGRLAGDGFFECDLASFQRWWVGSEVAQLRHLFDVVDKDGSGEVEVDELTDLLVAMNLISGADDVVAAELALHDADKDGNGSVDFPEFVSWWRAHAPEGGTAVVTKPARPPPREPPPAGLHRPARPSPPGAHRALVRRVWWWWWGGGGQAPMRSERPTSFPPPPR